MRHGSLSVIDAEYRIPNEKISSFSLAFIRGSYSNFRAMDLELSRPAFAIYAAPLPVDVLKSISEHAHQEHSPRYRPHLMLDFEEWFDKTAYRSTTKVLQVSWSITES